MRDDRCKHLEEAYAALFQSVNNDLSLSGALPSIEEVLDMLESILTVDFSYTQADLDNILSERTEL